MNPLAVNPAKAAEMLSMSRNFFDREVKPYIKVVYLGQRVVIPVSSLERWLETQAVVAA